LARNPYSPHTDDDRRAMLARLGIAKVDDLLTAIPADARSPDLGVPSGLTEAEVTALTGALAAQNRQAGSGPFFMGGVVQRRYIPAAVATLALRSEFLTAYTPYQPEVSQGTLQAIWEYQSLMCDLLAMDVTNSSMYEGGSAVAEAAFMAVRATRRNRVVVASEVEPQFRATLRTYARGPGIEVVELPARDLAAAAGGSSEPPAALIVQHPDSLGALVDVRSVVDAAHAAGALCVQVVDPIACSVLEPPGALGVDIAVGEGQPLGIAMSFGGPYLGILACRESLVRQMPGRIVGQTVDSAGVRGFVNTLQTREQHIRREKATSNICTNEAIAAITACVYLALMGPRGLRAAALLSAERAHALARRLGALPGCSVALDGPFLDQFPLRTPLRGEVLRDALLAHRIMAGPPCTFGHPERPNDLIFRCTELTTDADIEACATALGAVVAESREPVAAR
jgi:glycine dehydrogenase subunit 1